MQRLNGAGPVYYQFDQWAAGDRLIHGIFTRIGGVSAAPWTSLNLGGTVGDDPAAVRENHRRMYGALGLDGERACTVWQVHGADTVVARERVPGRRWLARADAIITDRPGLPLTMRYADCTPIVLYDPAHHAAALVHAGWRGTVCGAGPSAVQAMQAAFGTRPDELQAGIGPCIGPAHYQVGEEVVAAVDEAFGATVGLVRRAADGSAYLDLAAANRLALDRAGVGTIELSGLCTATRTEEFFSHRAERGRTGRFGVVVALVE